MNIKAIFWDFDGTIADTLAFVIEIADSLKEKFDFINLDKNKADYYRGLSVKEMMKELNIPFYKLPFLALKFKVEMSKHIDQLKVVSGLKSVIFELNKNYKLGILTSNSEENVKMFLERNNLKKFFCCVHSENQIFGKHLSLKKIMKIYNLQKEEILYIGDEVRDIQAAKKVGIKIISVAWGFNSVELLKSHKPDFIAHKPDDLLKVIQKINQND